MTSALKLPINLTPGHRVLQVGRDQYADLPCRYNEFLKHYGVVGARPKGPLPNPSEVFPGPVLIIPELGTQEFIFRGHPWGVYTLDDKYKFRPPRGFSTPGNPMVTTVYRALVCLYLPQDGF